MDSQPQPMLQLQNPAAQNSPPIASPSIERDRKQAMKEVHQKILPDLLCSRGWQKVYDKDMKITYRALYFNTIEKQPNEDDISHIQRVSKYREMIRDEVERFMIERRVNFKINSLLSRPLLYDPTTLQEQSIREVSTQRQRQTQIDTFLNKKT